MDDLLLPRAVAAVLNGDTFAAFRDLITGTTPAGVIAAAQDAAALQRPSLAVHGQFGQYPFARMGELIFELRSRVGDETQERQHSARFHALLDVLFGEDGSDAATTAANNASAKAAFKAALAALPEGAVALGDYGSNAQGVEQTFDGEDLVTKITLKAAWKKA